MVYHLGDGVTKDDTEAYKWLVLAATGGDDIHKKLRLELEQNLPQNEIAEAQRRVRSFHPKSIP